jgi:lipoprotein signal peptidase
MTFALFNVADASISVGVVVLVVGVWLHDRREAKLAASKAEVDVDPLEPGEKPDGGDL